MSEAYEEIAAAILMPTMHKLSLPKLRSLVG
jgi:hypothetical protein